MSPTLRREGANPSTTWATTVSGCLLNDLLSRFALPVRPTGLFSNQRLNGFRYFWAVSLIRIFKVPGKFLTFCFLPRHGARAPARTPWLFLDTHLSNSSPASYEIGTSQPLLSMRLLCHRFSFGATKMTKGTSRSSNHGNSNPR